MATLINANPAKSGQCEAKIQRFFFTAPTALSVQLVGDFTHWQRAPINLQKGSDSIWRTEVELEPGPHRYRFLVDGQWRDDPACPLRLPNPFGSEDDVRQVN
jgi:1,4-alpha-glucan branching enzyme